MERVSDGELVVEGLDHLAPDDRQKLQANLHDVRNEVLPNDTSTASSDLLAKLGIESIFVQTEQRAAAEVQRICQATRTLGWTSRLRRCRISAESVANSRHQKR